MDKSFLELLKLFSGMGGQNPFASIFGQQPPHGGYQNFSNQNNSSPYQNAQNSQNTQQNNSYSYYPNEAYSQQNQQQYTNNSQNQNNSFFQNFGQNPFGAMSQDNNMLPLLMSMMSKGGNPFAEILSQTQKSSPVESSQNIEEVDPKDEILL